MSTPVNQDITRIIEEHAVMLEYLQNLRLDLCYGHRLNGHQVTFTYEELETEIDAILTQISQRLIA